MGLPMVRRLLTAGHQVQVHARRPEVRAELEHRGARVVGSAREAAEGSGLVIVCAFSDAQLVEITAGPDGLLAGLAGDAVLASHVTGTRAVVEVLAAATSGQVVDAPISGTAQDIDRGDLTVLLGGDPDAVQRCTDVMKAYASRLIPVGPRGGALAVKLVNNLLFAAHSQLAIEAVALADQLGVRPEVLLHSLSDCSGNSYAVATLARVGDVGAFATAATPFLRKDVAACETELAAAGAQADLLLDVVRRGRLELT
jgi:3-hydroxyisobutyrate dehydrogenase-like beta-hydroxyacid dehydrogenase